MNQRPTTMERAYQLAGGGECATVAEIKTRLSREGYADAQMQIQGAALGAALRRLITASRTRGAGFPERRGGDSPPGL